MKEIAPQECTALQMQMNPVGFKPGTEYACRGCGAFATMTVVEESTSPDPAQVRPAQLCPFPPQNENA